MQRYHNLANEGAFAYHEKRFRDAADKYLKATRVAPDGVWTPCRYQFFSSYTVLLTERFFKASASDLKTLRKDFISNEKEPSIFRVDAALSFGLVKWDAGDKEATGAYYRLGLEIAAATSESERCRLMQFSKGDSTYTRTVGDVMDELTKTTKENLRKLERPKFSSCPDAFEIRSDGSKVPSRQAAMPLSSNESLTEQVLTVGGANCDCCGKSRQELGTATLMICTRCKMAYYCSKECQKAQWKAGHKQACRKEGQIEIGDLMQLHGLVSQPRLNSKIGKIQGPADTSSSSSTSSRWAVYLPDEDRVIAVSADRLKRLRPTK
jgi:hypothetical protein